MIHRSRFPPYYVLPLFLIPAAPLSGWSTFGNILGILGLIMFLSFVFIWYNIRYGFGENGLFINDGLSAERSFIGYSDIERVEVRDGLSLEHVAGLSYHRVAVIVDGKVRVQISPRHRDAFVTELKKRISLSRE